MNQHVKTILIWVVIISIVLILIRVFTANDLGSERIEQSAFYQKVDEGKIQSVTMTGDAVGFTLKGQYKERTPNNKDGFTTYIVKDDSLLKKMRDAGVQIKAEKPKDPSMMLTLITYAPLLLLVGDVDLLHAPDAVGRQQGAVLRQEQGEAALRPRARRSPSRTSPASRRPRRSSRRSSSS